MTRPRTSAGTILRSLLQKPELDWVRGAERFQVKRFALKIFHGSLDEPNVIPQLTKAGITIRAQQTPYLARRVVMVNTEALPLCWLYVADSASVAFNLVQHFKLASSQPIRGLLVSVPQLLSGSVRGQVTFHIQAPTRLAPSRARHCQPLPARKAGTREALVASGAFLLAHCQLGRNLHLLECGSTVKGTEAILPTAVLGHERTLAEIADLDRLHRVTPPTCCSTPPTCHKQDAGASLYPPFYHWLTRKAISSRVRLNAIATPLPLYTGEETA